MFPAVYDLPVEKSRILLIFVLSCWRWALELRNVSEYCEECDSLLNSWHLMFQCARTQGIRDEFRDRTGRYFSYSVLRDSLVSGEVIGVLNRIIRFLRQSLL
jgi:hypothetical protein